MNRKTLWFGVIVIAVAMSSCKKDPGEGSRESVEDAGYELTTGAFFRAAESDDLKTLRGMLDAGMSLEQRDDAGRTGLHAAAGSGAMRSVDFFLDGGLGVEVKDDRGRTPLMEAVMESSPEMVRHLLRQGADPQAKDENLYKPLMLAVREGRDEMVTVLAPYVRQDLDDALLAAAILGQTKLIDELTNYGASVYARVADGRTPLMLAAEYGHEEAVDLLLMIGANRFGMDEAGRTAAELARENGHGELAERLSGAPEDDDFELTEPAEMGVEMAATVEEMEDGVALADSVTEEAAVSGEGAEEGAGGASDAGGDPVDSGSGADTVADGGDTGVSTEAPRVAALEGTVVGRAEEPAEAGARSRSAAAGGDAASRDSADDSSADPTEDDAADSEEAVASGDSPSPAADVPIIMRAYRETELPVRVESTRPGVAEIRVAGGEKIDVREGERVRGSRLKVVRIDRRVRSGKSDGGRPLDVSVVTVADESSGIERELVTGLPAMAHDPVALVEDAATGSYYVARTGQRFRAVDGREFVVGDVRPSQIVIENAETGETTTLPLRGPRG